jgi:hypothetical protein
MVLVLLQSFFFVEFLKVAFFFFLVYAAKSLKRFNFDVWNVELDLTLLIFFG